MRFSSAQRCEGFFCSPLTLGSFQEHDVKFKLRHKEVMISLFLIVETDQFSGSIYSVRV